LDPGQVLNRSRQASAEETPAFGGIAERFRRAGQLDRAVTLCREGLQKFPEHLSARVTLGWALLDQGKYDEAQVELEQVLKRAPDNLAAIRGLAELHERAENAVELSLDGPGPWPPDAAAIAAATPAAADDRAPVQQGTDVEDDAAVPVATVPTGAPPPPGPVPTVAAPITYEGTISPTESDLPVSPATAAEMKAFADLLIDPVVEPVPAPVEVDEAKVAEVEIGVVGADALLKALDELEDVSPVEAAPASAEADIVDVPVLAEPALDELVGALESTEPAAAHVEPAAIHVEPVVAAAAPDPVSVQEVNVEAEPEVSDGFALTGESPSDRGAAAESDPAPAESARLADAADTDTLSLDFDAPAVIEVPVQEPVPVGPAPPSVRSQATIRVLERMLTRVQTRRVEVASEYHLAS
jgi:tetratricopeptide (TPR) repeat protein